MSKKKFIGTIGRNIRETEYRYENIPDKTPKGAPNVIYIVLDDLGFSQLGCYGSSINTPNIDKLAANGLRYNNFHTTAICSATRASLLTGANHHSVGVNATIEMITGCPNGAGEVDKGYAYLSEILQEYGYDTFACGKWHLTSNGALNQAGPYDSWPLGRGFNRYYGFLHAMMNQYNPILIQDNSFVEQPKTADEGYHFSEDITDHAIDFISTQKNAYPDKPFFLYLAYGAMHAPHHAPKEYIDRYKGKFDKGWDVLREEWFANQKKLGIIPADTELNERNAYVPAWDSLNDDQKKVCARFMEAFAGMLEHTDAQIGRVTDYLEKIGELDNTLIVFISDNGASPEGGPEGHLNMNNACNIVSKDDTTEEALANLDKIGGPYTQNHYPVGWANLGNTPFQWYKTWVHSGGVKDPMIVSYPNGIEAKGAIRSQYHHVIDITPTVLDVIGIEKPEIIKGIPQKPMQGKSFKYSFDSDDREQERKIQYYEMLGNKGIYKNGWKAVTNHTFNDSFDEDEWELYHVETDFSEKNNVADKYPEKLRELQDEWLIEAGKYGVFPQHMNSHVGGPDAIDKLIGADRFVPGKVSEYKHIYKYFDLAERSNTQNNSFVLTIDFVRTDVKQQGVLFSTGDRFGGWSLYIKDNILTYTLNANGKTEHTVTAGEVPIGRAEAKLEVKVIKDKANRHSPKTAFVAVYINGEKKAEEKIDNYNDSTGNSFETIGANRYVSVTENYTSPFIFEGDIEYVKIKTPDSTVTTEELIDAFMAID
ncbi:MAG: arylsulfatase [Oscillospiraceae bacterium]